MRRLVRLFTLLAITPFFSYSLLLAQEAVPADKQLEKFGLQYDTAEELYLALKKKAGGGQRLKAEKIPDWSGLYSRTVVVKPSIGFVFDPNQTTKLPGAKLTPKYHDMLMAKRNALEQEIEYDPISSCQPPSHPRWLTSPFLREHIITPDITLLISEVTSSVRRIYTDGREHTPKEDAYPLYFGDSIGFWDDDKLVIHTSQLMAGQYTRGQPDYSEQVETVEIWQKYDDQTLIADVWVYDPPALLEPWYVRQTYSKLTNDDHSLRIRHWNCAENPNNSVIESEEGSSDFLEFQFSNDE